MFASESSAPAVALSKKLGRELPSRDRRAAAADSTTAEDAARPTMRGERTLIGPLANERYKHANAAAEAIPEAAPHASAPIVKRAPAVPVEIWRWRLYPGERYESQAHPAGVTETITILRASSTT